MLGRIRYDPPGAPLSVARYIYEHSPGLHGRLLHWHGQFWLHDGTHYRLWRTEEIHDVVRLLLEHAVFENKKNEDEPWNPTPAKVNNVVKMMETLVRLEFDTRAPAWVTDDPYGLRPGVADLRERGIRGIALNKSSRPTAYRPSAPRPTNTTTCPTKACWPQPNL